MPGCARVEILPRHAPGRKMPGYVRVQKMPRHLLIFSIFIVDPDFWSLPLIFRDAVDVACDEWRCGSLSDDVVDIVEYPFDSIWPRGVASHLASTSRVEAR